MTTVMTQYNIAFPQDDADWLNAEAARLGITRSELVRAAIRHFRATVFVPESAEAALEPAPQETSMTNPKSSSKLKLQPLVRPAGTPS